MKEVKISQTNTNQLIKFSHQPASINNIMTMLRKGKLTAILEIYKQKSILENIMQDQITYNSDTFFKVIPNQTYR